MQNTNDLITPHAGGSIPEMDRMQQHNTDSFRDGYDTVVLQKGKVLYRFTSGCNAYVFSDCWIDQPTFVLMMRELQNAINGTQPHIGDRWKREQILGRLAVLSDWNKVARRVKITLKRDVIAYVGEIGPQYVWMDSDEVGTGSSQGKSQKCIEVRKGGHIQYVIPRFKKRQASLDPSENEYAVVNANTHVFKHINGR